MLVGDVLLKNLIGRATINIRGKVLILVISMTKHEGCQQGMPTSGIGKVQLS